ncbi:MAG: hypothetical protein RMI90_06820 [Thermoguttaceae bacterium]|nr:hypothetical protein [Thermoguttaceae bacterium]
MDWTAWALACRLPKEIFHWLQQLASCLPSRVQSRRIALMSIFAHFSRYPPWAF